MALPTAPAKRQRISAEPACCGARTAARPSHDGLPPTDRREGGERDARLVHRRPSVRCPRSSFVMGIPPSKAAVVVASTGDARWAPAGSRQDRAPRHGNAYPRKVSSISSSILRPLSSAADSSIDARWGSCAWTGSFLSYPECPTDTSGLPRKRFQGLSGSSSRPNQSGGSILAVPAVHVSVSTPMLADPFDGTTSVGRTPHGTPRAVGLAPVSDHQGRTLIALDDRPRKRSSETRDRGAGGVAIR